MPVHSRRIRDKIDLVRAPLREAAGAVWNHPRLADFYPDFLFTMHSLMRATSPQLRAAADAAEARAHSDPVAAGIAGYLAQHSKEETGHDEWAMDDLAVMGVAREEVLQRMPSPHMAALVGSQYYWIHHFHPVAYLSYIAVIEGPPSVDFLEHTIQRTGLPREAFRTQFLHAQIDPHHVQELDALIDGLNLNDWHHSVLGANAFHTVDLLTKVYRDVVDRFERGVAGFPSRFRAKH